MQSGLFPYFTECGLLFRLTGFNMAFRKAVLSAALFDQDLADPAVFPRKNDRSAAFFPVQNVFLIHDILLLSKF